MQNCPLKFTLSSPLVYLSPCNFTALSVLRKQQLSKPDKVVLFTCQNFASKCGNTFEWYCISYVLWYIITNILCMYIIMPVIQLYYVSKLCFASIISTTYVQTLPFIGTYSIPYTHALYMHMNSNCTLTYQHQKFLCSFCHHLEWWSHCDYPVF